jgi:competence protein ComEC
MLLFGWGALLLGIEVFRFAFLLVVGTVLIVLFPGLALSWGFWLSMGGVYVIFLLLKYGPVRESLWTRLLLLPVGIYWLMVPVGHTLFGTVNLWQNLSPLLSVLFIPFYPLAMLLHLLGQGALLDPVLAWLWRLPGENMVSKTLPLWFLGLYMLVALAAVRWRRAFYLLLGLAGGSLIWIYG